MMGVDEIAAKYASELSELKCNSKPLINSLTMMAEDYIGRATVIVQTIENHLRRVKPELKLPVLYLIDSIVKNVKKEYLELFTLNIVSTFTTTFEQVPEKIRTQMWKLRQTWNDVFPTKKLYSIDYKCHQTDPGWPITAAPPSTSSIHVNPKFLARALTISPATAVTTSLVSSTVASPSASLLPGLAPNALGDLGIPSFSLDPPGDVTEAQMREQLLMKQKELLELQTKKLELELLHTKAQLEERTRKQNILHSKQPEAQSMQQQLLQQAEMAKHQTDLATTLLSKTTPSAGSIIPASNSMSPLTPSPSVSSTTTTTAPLSTATTSTIASHSASSAVALQDPRKRREKDKDKDRAESKSKHHRHSHKTESSPSELSGLRPRPSPTQLSSTSSATISHVIHPIGIIPPAPTSSATMSSAGASLPDPRKRMGTPDSSLKSPHVERSPSKEKDHTLVQSVGHGHRSRSSPQSSTSDPRQKSLSPGKDKSLSKEREPLPPLDPIFSDPRKRKHKEKEPSVKSPSKSSREREIRDRSVSAGSSNGSNVNRIGGVGSSSLVAAVPGIEPMPTPLNAKGGDVPSKRRKKSGGEGSGGSGSGSRDKDKDHKEKEIKEKRSGKGKTSSSTRNEREAKVSKEKEVDRERGRHGGKDIDYKNRKKSVLMRNYRRTTEVAHMMEDDDEGKVAPWKRDKGSHGHGGALGAKDSVVTMGGKDKEDLLDSSDLEVLSALSGKVVGPGGDVDFRYESLQDVDLRSKRSAGEPIVDSGDQPPLKKARNGNLIDDLFGREDVDLRQHPSATSSWSQMKKRPGLSPGLESLGLVEGGIPDLRLVIAGDKDLNQDEDIREILAIRSRPPSAISPANSVDSNRSSCDPLGRPLLYNRLPDDPAERKLSLDSRTSSIDPVERFRAQYIERASMGGDLSNADLKKAVMQAQREFEMNYFTREQYDMIMRQLMQINEVNKIREVQQMQQVRGLNNMPGPNPWTETESSDVWSRFSTSTRSPADFRPARFPTPMGGAAGGWGAQQPMPMNWGQQQPPPRGPNPFEEAAAAAAIPAGIMDDLLPPVNRIELEIVRKDTSGTIPIDKVMRQVRFYDETAIVLQGSFLGDEPREISFQKSVPKNVFIDQEREPVRCFIGKPALIYLDRKKHNLKLGAPTRELYIDGDHYEGCFGGPPIRVRVDRYWHNFKLEGPPPQVEVGKVLRYDLLAGRVNLFIDGNSMAVYLDEKPQLIDLCGFPVIFRFCEEFHTVLLNNRPFPTDFGGLPMSVTVPGGRKHYLRLSGLSSSTQRAMFQFVRAKQGPGREHQDGHPMVDGFGGAFRGRGGRGGRGGPMMMGRGGNRPPLFNMGPMMPPMGGSMEGMRPPLPPGTGTDMFPPMAPLTFETNPNPLDVLANIMPSPSADMNSHLKENSENNYEIDNFVAEGGGTEGAKSEKSQAPLDVQDLLSKLMMAGLLPALTGPETGGGAKKEEIEETSTKEKDAKPELKVSKSDGEELDVVKEEVKEVKKEEPVEKIIPPLETVDVSWDKLKERRDKLIAQICTGVQCGSCGLRFPPDQNVRYSQHLDWHFRQNRREKANARKALSRKWYYDLSDWIQFAEIEDLEERAQSLFETQEIDMDGDPRSPGTVLNPDLYTVLSAGYEGVLCPQCNEGFESFFDEDKEEWRLRDAFLAESEDPGVTKLYHPICHQDFMAALQGQSTLLEVASPKEEEEPKAEAAEVEAMDVSKEGEEADKAGGDDDEEVLILKEGKPEPVVMDIDIVEEDEEVKPMEESESLAAAESGINVCESETTVIEPRDSEEKETRKDSDAQNNESMICIDVDDNDDDNNKTENQLPPPLSPNTSQLQKESGDTTSCITHIEPTTSDTPSSSEPNLADTNSSSSTTTTTTLSKNISVNVLSSLSLGGGSPATITIPDDETSDGEGAHLFQSITGQVFDIALGNSNQGCPSPTPDTPAPDAPKRIIYQSMKFDIPTVKIKTEPVDPDEEEEEASSSFDFIMRANLQPIEEVNLEEPEDISSSVEPPPSGPAPVADTAVDIDLTGEEEESAEASSAASTAMAALDGNFQFSQQAPSHQIAPLSKIRIRITDAVLSTDSQSPKSSPKNSPARPTEDSAAAAADPVKASETDKELDLKSPVPNSGDDEESSVKKGIVHNIIVSSSTENRERMERLKPKLANRNLVNYPPKQTGKEVSGLCTIC